MAVFSNIIQQKRVLDAGQLFPSSHVWDERPSFHRKKNYRVKGRFFQENLTFVPPKNEIKKDHPKRSKVDNLNVHRKRSFIN